ncbi:hypothetical protein BC936DRAFT_137863 [Jimgerdemannia flammicorona]|uniref:Uncharacterized protein n=1 Tax=Jimgerdemannia flammicorona TaxID=994334 RepID=A0A433DIR2_9FUNG|nr:hypothetical protein BC936DRAFT_137863 [Jimgerdemannia flammicorona]
MRPSKGHPSGRRFRSPGEISHTASKQYITEMIPHVLWLDNEPSTRSKHVCSCNVCNPRSKTSGSTTLPRKPTTLPNPPRQPSSLQLRPLLPAWPPAQILGMYPALSIAQPPNLPPAQLPMQTPVKAPTRFLAKIPLPPRTPSPTPDQIVAPATPVAIKPEPTWCAQNDTPAVQTEFEFVNVGLEEMRRERKRKRNWKTPIWAPVETKEWEWVVFDMTYFARRRGMAHIIRKHIMLTKCASLRPHTKEYVSHSQPISSLPYHPIPVHVVHDARPIHTVHDARPIHIVHDACPIHIVHDSRPIHTTSGLKHLPAAHSNPEPGHPCIFTGASSHITPDNFFH